MPSLCFHYGSRLKQCLSLRSFSCGAACPHGGQRDQWGNCIQAGCSSWFDGCNTCQVDSRGNCNSLSEVMCYQVVAGSAECRDASSTDGGHSTGRPGGGGADAGFNCCSGGSACGYTHCPALGAGQEGCVQPWAMPDGMTADTCKVAAPVSSAGPPEGCTTWFDGCNTCGRDTSDAPMMCTMMACLQNGATECRGWAAGYGANAAHAGGARCSTTATRGNSRGTPCPAGLTCVITDPGHPEYDQPNSGVCQAAAAAVHHGNDACWCVWWGLGVVGCCAAPVSGLCLGVRAVLPFPRVHFLADEKAPVPRLLQERTLRLRLLLRWCHRQPGVLGRAVHLRALLQRRRRWTLTNYCGARSCSGLIRAAGSVVM